MYKGKSVIINMDKGEGAIRESAPLPANPSVVPPLLLGGLPTQVLVPPLASGGLDAQVPMLPLASGGLDAQIPVPPLTPGALGAHG